MLDESLFIRFVVVLARTATGFALGWLAAGVFTQRWGYLVITGVVGARVANLTILELFVRSLFSDTEAVRLPRRMSKRARHFNAQVVAARIMIERDQAQGGLANESLERWRDAVVSSAAYVSRTEGGRSAREILDLRSSLDGSRDAQAAWGEIIHEAERAISTGEEQFTASRRVADDRP
jgi:hypothetical protein